MYEIPVRKNVVITQTFERGIQGRCGLGWQFCFFFNFISLSLSLSLIYALLNQNNIGRDIHIHNQNVTINLYFVIFAVVFYPESRSSKFLRNINKYLPYCTV